eukprot:gnl/MRDRNA2_/MRDRNA2_40193_c0_seq1.p1 gnl/MRDRNA2_/MRDRNA2_40193_c0~~gnl/MRDRNA2_/MRDRNA2_40193_c0_seq1.p1  ORF type:complete len:127 (-),score=26.40 gnl/MRDRNA2_/MRDRNA2_40193_c0_seq1:124-504(-)
MPQVCTTFKPEECFKPEEKLPGTPRTPIRARRQHAYSPPPAPKSHGRLALDSALDSNDLLEVVEILAKQPGLSGMPLANGRLPLKYAMDMGCDASIIDVLEDRISSLPKRGASFEPSFENCHLLLQ